MIGRIQITNFKSIKYLDLALNDINVFIGANGVGKSNFISFFKLLRKMREGRLNTYIAANGYMDNLLFFGKKEADEIIGSIRFSSEDKIPSHEYSFNLSSDNQKNAFIKEEKSGINKSNHHSNEWWFDTHSVNHEESYVLKKGTTHKDLFIRSYFDSFKIHHFHDTSKDSPLKKTARVSDNVFLRENGENLPAFLYFLQEKHPKRLRRIERIIASIAPFFHSFNLKPDRINEEFIQLEWKEKGFDRYQNAQNLSDGTLRFIALTTLMLQPNPPKTIIIDEPELGLHPSAINKLAGLIRKASAHSQIILSTQSINLVNNFEPEDIVTVDRENHESIFRRLNSKELAAWLDDYSIGDLWSKSVIGGQP